MKNIHTLISDIYATVQRKDGWFDGDLANSFSQDLGSRLAYQLSENTDRPTLRLSQMGPRCPRALWYSIHHPELREPLPAWAEIKYSYGHILEALVIVLAKAAGHEVTGEQDAVSVDGVVGHRDCVIDGCIVDVKSSASRSFLKFKDGTLPENDLFGYLDQLDGYVVGSSDDPLVRVRDRGYILAVDKQLGHLCLYEHIARPDQIRNRIQVYKDIVSRTLPPHCTCGTVPHGAKGSLKLDTRASYSPFKYACIPNLRTFLYSNGPVYLTKVVEKPDVPEVDKYGNYIH